MTNEYITKAQAIAIAESMRNLMAKGVADAFIKGIEGVEGYRGIATNATFEGEKVVALDGLTKVWSRKVEDKNPCTYCDAGWATISTTGCTSCREDCERLKEWERRNIPLI